MKKTVRRLFEILVLFTIFVSTFKANGQSSSCKGAKAYSNNRIDYFTFQPCDAKTITLTFNCFKVADAGDLLRVYDGTDASGKPLHSGLGFTYGNPPPDSLMAFSGAMYLYFTTDGSGTDSGFVVNWKYEKDTTKGPIALFEIPDTIYNSVAYTFKNVSKNLSNPLKKYDYVWEIEPGFGEVGFQKDLNYTFSTNKTYDVSLSVTSCIGTNKFTKSVVVITPDYKVWLDIKASTIKTFIDSVVTLKAVNFTNFKRPFKADRFKWSFSPADVTYINGTVDSPTIQVKFTKAANYTVHLEAWNSTSPIKSFNEVIKKDFITIKEPLSPKVYIDLIAKNLNPKIGVVDTLYAIDTMDGKLYKANRFKWQFVPDQVTYINGSRSDQKTIFVKFNKTGKYTISLKAWNSADSTASIDDTVKLDYIVVQNAPVFVDFVSNNLKPKIGQLDTLIAVDAKNGNPFAANKYNWKFNPDNVTFMNGTNAESKQPLVKFNQTGRYTISLTAWNSFDSTATLNDNTKMDYISVMDAPVFLNFKAHNLYPKVDEVDTFIALDSLNGNPFNANRYQWNFLPANIIYVNGTSQNMQTIQVKFASAGKYQVTLSGWNSADSAATFNEIYKVDYITVFDSFITIKKLSNTNTSVDIYPNPCDGILNFYFKEGTAPNTSIQVFNCLGQLSTEINKIEKNFQSIDLSNQPNGIYTVKVKIDNRQLIQKISLLKN
jgi:hypothetical protein